MADPKHRKLSPVEAIVEIADPARLKRFDVLAGEFGYGRALIALLSKPGGSSEHLWSRQYELRDQGKDAFRLCCGTQDLHASLIADFVAAAMEARFTVMGFIGATIQPLDPQLFGMPGLQLRLDRNEITLPDGSIVWGIQIRTNRKPEVAGVGEAPGEPSAAEPPPKAENSNLPSEAVASPSCEALKPDHQPDGGRRGGRGRTPKPIWEGAENEMMQWLDNNGCPEPGDGGQAALEDHITDWLAQRGYYLAESTVRAHVGSCLARRRAQ
jgi:hypothetical protein